MTTAGMLDSALSAHEMEQWLRLVCGIPAAAARGGSLALAAGRFHTVRAVARVGGALPLLRASGLSAAHASTVLQHCARGLEWEREAAAGRRTAPPPAPASGASAAAGATRAAGAARAAGVGGGATAAGSRGRASTHSRLYVALIREALDLPPSADTVPEAERAARWPRWGEWVRALRNGFELEGVGQETPLFHPNGYLHQHDQFQPQLQGEEPRAPGTGCFWIVTRGYDGATPGQDTLIGLARAGVADRSGDIAREILLSADTQAGQAGRAMAPSPTGAARLREAGRLAAAASAGAARERRHTPAGEAAQEEAAAAAPAADGDGCRAADPAFNMALLPADDTSPSPPAPPLSAGAVRAAVAADALRRHAAAVDPAFFAHADAARAAVMAGAADGRARQEGRAVTHMLLINPPTYPYGGVWVSDRIMVCKL
jgi:hypothetical protein